MSKPMLKSQRVPPLRSGEFVHFETEYRKLEHITNAVIEVGTYHKCSHRSWNISQMQS